MLRDDASKRSLALKEELDDLESLTSDLLDLKDYVDRFTDEYQSRVIGFVEDLVTKGLQDVFSEELAFKILAKERAGQITYDFAIVDAYIGAEVDPLSAKGGGVVEVTAVLLRVILLYLNRHRLRQVLILDENVSHLALEYVPAMAGLLRQLADRLGIQIILVTHQQGFIEAADVIVRASKVKGITQLEIEEGEKQPE